MQNPSNSSTCTCVAAQHTCSDKESYYTYTHTHEHKKHLPVHDLIPNVTDFPQLCFSWQPL